MLFKIIIVFLLAMALVGMIGKALFPGALEKIARGRKKGAKHPVCTSCGRYLIGNTGCDCGKS